MAKRPLVCPGDWQKLLVCTDGSPYSQGAVAGALELARACGSKVYVLQVIEIIPEFEAVVPDLRASVEEAVRRQMAAIQNEAAARGVIPEWRISHSTSAFAAIVEEVERIQPHLIVMGRHGRTGLSRLLMGSVTARVIGYCPVKVLVVPRGVPLAFDTILVASDGSGDSAAAFAEALSMCQRAKSALVAVSVAREEGEIAMAEDIIRQMLQAANQKGVPLRGLVPEGQAAADAIVQAALRNEVDLIVMGSHGRAGLKRLLMGSVTERVIGQAPCPVLVVRQ